MDLERAARKIIERYDVAPWGPDDLRKAASPPRRREQKIDYATVGSGLYGASGGYAGDFGRGGTNPTGGKENPKGRTGHRGRVRYVAGQTDSASGRYYDPDITPGVVDPAAPDFLPIQKGGGRKRLTIKDKGRGRAAGRMKADIRWAARPDRKVSVVNPGAGYRPGRDDSIESLEPTPEERTQIGLSKFLESIVGRRTA